VTNKHTIRKGEVLVEKFSIQCQKFNNFYLIWSVQKPAVYVRATTALIKV